MSNNNDFPAANKFAHHLQVLQQLLAKAGTQKNPALWLSRNNARTPLFMLEGLSRLYAHLHNKKRFLKMKEQFKLLEDALGFIDHYSAMATELSANKKIPLPVIKYLKAQTNNKLAYMNEVLADKNWLGTDNKRIKKISDKLADADWLAPADDLAAIKKEFQEEIADITDFVMDTNFHFNNMEADVHELRRKLRWLSIYPQALMGNIQLAATKKPAKHLAKYLTKPILTSPYNVMPPPPAGMPVWSLDKNHFLALSWIIAELGNLKDQGLRIMALKEALEHTEKLNEADAYKKAHQLCGNKSPGILPLLDKAEAITKVFFKEQNLLHLIKATS
jgi:hypothetical protein